MKEILRELFLTRGEFAKKYGLNKRTVGEYIRGGGGNLMEVEYLHAIKMHIYNLNNLQDDIEDRKNKGKKSYLNDIDLNNTNYNFILNTEECKIISIELDIKHPVILLSDNGSVTFEGHLCTSYEGYNDFVTGEVNQKIKILNGYNLVGTSSNKYLLTLTFLKR